MHLLELHCRAFRCLSELAFKPSEGINVIRGHNAQGKTTVLEAILFAATSKSHRTNIERDLLQYGAEGFQVRVGARRGEREVAIEANWWRGDKRFKVNGVSQTRMSDILGRLNVVFFSPEDVDLVKGGAASRRRFLDMEISQIHPGYLAALQHYRQALRQRNELLRRAAEPEAGLLAVWDAQLAQHGAQLIDERAAYVAQLSQFAQAAYQRIAGAETLALGYRPDVNDTADLEAVLAQSRATDVKRRLTSRGPHRDDLEILVAGRPARAYASQGQQKTAALALKLAELELVHARTGEYPVLLLDEVLAELDEPRSQRLFETIDGRVQCIVTTTDTEQRTVRLGPRCRDFLIQGGALEEA